MASERDRRKERSFAWCDWRGAHRPLTKISPGRLAERFPAVEGIPWSWGGSWAGVKQGNQDSKVLPEMFSWGNIFSYLYLI